MASMPRIKLQIGSLYASNDESWFTGTGGPWGYSPWTGQFGGIVGSAGLAAEPFDDAVHNVAAGDEVVFVIAAENIEGGASAWDVGVRAIVPPGFVVPEDGLNLSVTDGAGNVLAASGDIFGRDGLSIASPLSGWDPESGRNIALITYSLQAGPSTPAPNAALPSSVKLIRLAATPGGDDVTATRPAAAQTIVVTAAPNLVVVPLTDPSAVSRGQTIAFDVALPVPQGTLSDVRIQTLLPEGPASLSLVSAEITGVGGGLSVYTPQIGPEGSVALGDIVNPVATGDEATVTLRVILRAEGAVSGSAKLQMVVSADDPVQPGSRWTTSVASTVGVLVPPAPPVIQGVWTAQQATTAMLMAPFGGISFNGGMTSAPERSATMAVVMQDEGLGRFEPTATGNLDSTGRSFVTVGTLAQLQAAARSLVFNPGSPGLARFTITLVDTSGGVAQDSTTTIAIAAPAQLTGVADPGAIPHAQLLPAHDAWDQRPTADLYVLGDHDNAVLSNTVTSFGSDPPQPLWTSDGSSPLWDDMSGGAGFDPFLILGNMEGDGTASASACSPMALSMLDAWSRTPMQVCHSADWFASSAM